MINARRAHARLAAALGLAVALLGAMPGARAEVEVTPPRAFGHVVGDELEVVARPARGAPDPASLPRPGRVSRDLALRTAEVSDGAVRLRYQVIGAPESVALVEVPAWTLKVRDAGAEVEERIAAIPLTLSALTPPEPVARAGLEGMRPPQPVPPADEQGPRRRLAIYATIAALLGLLYAWSAWGRGWLMPRRAPFARARIELARLRDDVPHAGAEALRIAHRALDTRAGRVLLAPDLDAFLAARSHLAPMRDDLQELFQRSSAAFFADDAASSRDTLAFARELCRRAARIDRP